MQSGEQCRGVQLSPQPSLQLGWGWWLAALVWTFQGTFQGAASGHFKGHFRLSLIQSFPGPLTHTLFPTHLRRIGKVFTFLGLSVGVATSSMHDKKALQKAFAADITYTTAHQLAFSFLGDQSCYAKDSIVSCGEWSAAPATGGFSGL